VAGKEEIVGMQKYGGKPENAAENLCKNLFRIIGKSCKNHVYKTEIMFGICAEELLASVKFCFAVAVLYFIKSTDFGASWY